MGILLERGLIGPIPVFGGLALKFLPQIEKCILDGVPISVASSIVPLELPQSLYPEHTGFPVIETSSFRLLRNTYKNNVYAQCVHAFEMLSLRIREAAKDGVNGVVLPKTIRAEVLRKAILRAANRVKRDDNAYEDPILHIEGIRVDGTLDLSRAVIPFPIRMIGCLIEGGILLNHSRLTALDISGSYVRRGIEASYCTFEKNVRMRRAVSGSVVDLGASETGGTLDAVDVICLPLELPTRQTSWTARKSIFNLARSKIGGDVRLMRSRIYGGLNLRSATLAGSLFMNDLLVRSPANVAEKLITEQLPDIALEMLEAHQRSAVRAEVDLAHLVRREDWKGIGNSQRRRNLDAELLDGVLPPEIPTVGHSYDRVAFQGTLLARLIFGNEATCRSAVRAEHLSVRGMIMGRGLQLGGNCKFKSLSVKTELSLSGSHFRSANSVFAGLRKVVEMANRCALLSLIEFGDHILHESAFPQDTGRTQRFQYALDLRDSRIGSGLDLGKDSRNVADRSSDELIIRAIVERLIATGEDPVKFLQLFHMLPGCIFEYSEKDDVEDPNYQSRVKAAIATCRKVGRFLEPISYEFRDNLAAHARLRSIVALAEEIGDLKFDPDYFDQIQLPPGRMPDDKIIDSKMLERIVQACISLGRLKSTLLIGQVNIADAQIGGPLRLLGFITNLFGEDQRVTPVLKLNNSHIEGDCDFRDSAGITSIEAPQVTVKGSIRFANSPRYDLSGDLFGPLRRRALLTAKSEHDPLNTISPGTPFRRFDFERARVGGNFIVVFDKKSGPTIDLAYSNISGKLAIVPAIGGVEINGDEVHADETDSKIRRSVGRSGPYPLAKIFIAQALDRILRIQKTKSQNQGWIRRLVHGFVVRWSTLETNATRAKWIAQTHLPYVDLRSSTTEVFAHPPSAWPQQDGLLIEGMGYERSQEFGPLLAPRRRWGEVGAQKNSNVKWSFVSASITLGFGGAIAITQSVLSGLPPNYGTDPRHSFSYWIGEVNMNLSIWVGLLVLFLLLLRVATKPSYRQKKPLALSYLALQRRRLDEGKLRHAVQPHQPYIHAAKVLRSAGRTEAADRVELERLRLRRKLLSLRTSLPLRVMLKATDIVSQYGFRPMRVLYIGTGVLLLSAMLLHYGDRSALIVQSNLVRAERSANYGTSGVGRPTLFRAEKVDVSGNRSIEQRDPVVLTLLESEPNPRNPSGRLEASASERVYPKFISLLYAADVTVPFLDLGQEDRWTVIGSTGKSVKLEDPKTWMWFVPYFLRMFGWFATGIITIAVVARLETIMARNEDS